MAYEIFPVTTPEEIGHRLRNIRLDRGLTLTQVQKSSRGSLKAATLGSYERAERSLSIDRALDIARFYRIPLSHLLEGHSESEVSELIYGSAIKRKIVFDLRKMRNESKPDVDSEKVLYFITQLARKRSDWNGEILTMRSSDIATLAILLRIPEAEVIPWLEDHDLLVKKITKPNLP